jgi:hypothetical protein
MIQTEKGNEITPIRLGKKIELRYISFSELAIPWSICLDTTASRQQNQDIRRSYLYNFIQSNSKNSKASRILKSNELEHLKQSIARYGLLKPFEVAEMYERLDFFYGKGKYLVIDGKRRYFALRELLKLPTEDDEGKRKNRLWSESKNEIVAKGEIQAQERFDHLDIRDNVLVPCIVYPYTTLLQMVRHSVEDKRFSEKPTKQDYELVDKMTRQGINDLKSDDLRELSRVRKKLEEERASIEETLKDIRARLQQQQDQNKAEERTDTARAKES